METLVVLQLEILNFIFKTPPTHPNTHLELLAHQPKQLENTLHGYTQKPLFVTLYIHTHTQSRGLSERARPLIKHKYLHQNASSLENNPKRMQGECVVTLCVFFEGLFSPDCLHIAAEF